MAVNSDRSVRGNKGPERPLVPEQDRAEVLAALASVDYVTIFDEPTPRELIARVLPSVLVKGADWAPEQVAGREEVEAAGGRVVSIPLAPGYSTTNLVKRIRNAGCRSSAPRQRRQQQIMILSSVSETLASVSRHPALESAIAALRQGNARERLAGLTDTAKALVAAIVATELRRPIVVLVESGARAEVFAASMQFFYTALAGQEATEVTVLPAMDVLPWQDAAPHAEILENRAVTLWRYATGQARVVVAPIAAARMRLADAALLCANRRARWRAMKTFRSTISSRICAASATNRMTWWRCPANSPCAAESSTFFPRKPSALCASNCSGIPLNPCGNLIPNTQRSVRPIERVTLPPLVEQSGERLWRRKRKRRRRGTRARGALLVRFA